MAVSSPKVLTRSAVTICNFTMQDWANLAIRMAWSSWGCGKPELTANMIITVREKLLGSRGSRFCSALSSLTRYCNITVTDGLHCGTENNDVRPLARSLHRILPQSPSSKSQASEGIEDNCASFVIVIHFSFLVKSKSKSSAGIIYSRAFIMSIVHFACLSVTIQVRVYGLWAVGASLSS